jgi:hypothetical protein
MFEETRHKIEITIFLILVFIAFCTPEFWIQWTFGAFVAFIFLLVDLMFFNDADFVYDPDYNHWKDLNEPKDFQFEADFSSLKDQKKRF